MGPFGLHSRIPVPDPQCASGPVLRQQHWRGHRAGFGDYEVEDTVDRIRCLERAITAPLEVILTGAVPSVATPPGTSPAPDTEDCHAGPDRENIRITRVNQDLPVTEIWHSPQCPEYMIERIMLEASVGRAEEQDAWAKDAFPAPTARLRDSAGGRSRPSKTSATRRRCAHRRR
ncbi:hypothetical protein [Kitasatospora sp. NPDC057223]|uniref:hypothetical protein n=1 Tax=Kitasatospora sp. NPDC057223 TaxID=3346055 RepID=UPI0036420BD3